MKQKPNERAWVVTTGWTDEKGGITDSDTWEVSEQGLFYLNECVGQKPVPHCHLKLPGLAGEKWDPNPKGERQDRVRCVTLKSQRIKVPAGEFDAVGVETYHGKELVATCWYAAGVGLVKSELGGGDDKETWLVLKSFTPGKN